MAKARTKLVIHHLEGLVHMPQENVKVQDVRLCGNNEDRICSSLSDIPLFRGWVHIPSSLNEILRRFSRRSPASIMGRSSHAHIIQCRARLLPQS